MRVLLLILIAVAVAAQTPPTRTVTLTWEDTANPPGTTYTVYRSDGSCTGTPTFAPIASGVAVKTYTDPRTPGKYCYVVTASYAGEESEYSNSAGAQVRPWKPTNLSVEVR